MRRANRVLGVLAVAGIAALGTPGTAPAESAFGGGTVEIRTDVSYDRETREFDGEEVGTQTDAEATLRLGIFLTDMIEVAGGFLYGYKSEDPVQGTDLSDSYYGARGDVVLNVPTAGPIVPFVGGGVGFVAYGSGDLYGDESSMIFPAFEGGLRFLVGNSASINCVAGYRKTTNVGGMKDLDSSGFTFTVGISAFPRRR